MLNEDKVNDIIQHVNYDQSKKKSLEEVQVKVVHASVISMVSVASAVEFSLPTPMGKSDSLSTELSSLKLDFFDVFKDTTPELNTKSFDLSKVQPQNFNYFLVLDLEGNIEILEFHVLLIDAKTLELVDFFHRFTSIPFKDVIPQFEDWVVKHNLLTKELGGHLNKVAFITCGNWDIKTKIPYQCKVSRMELPPYFMEWIKISRTST
ncbi:hypothetical protein AgCh_023228 [Apium graveolens]